MQGEHRKRWMGAVCAFHLIYFAVFSTATFLPRYFGELGMSDGQIGMIVSLPAIVGVITQPYFGALTDRARQKKFVLIGLLAALAAVCFVLQGQRTFAALVIGMTAYYVLQLPVAPAFAAVALDYTRQRGIDYGPIRIIGTVGYQAGALLVGVVLASSLSGLYALLGWIAVAACAAACFLPPVPGYQHGKQKISPQALLQDKHIVWLLAMVLIGATTSEFYNAFYAKHLGDLGISNTMTSVLLIVSVLMEFPFLIFGDRLLRRVSVWNWLLIGYAANAVRWLGLSMFQSVGMLLVLQLPAVSVLACFEFFPGLYLNGRVPDALKGTAQSTLMIVCFGISKVIGSLLGGFASDWFGIPAVFGFNGVMLVVGIPLFFGVTRRMIREERAAD